MEKPDRHMWEEDSTHRSVAGDEYDEVWDYAEQLEAKNERYRNALLELQPNTAFLSWHMVDVIKKALGGES